MIHNRIGTTGNPDNVKFEFRCAQMQAGSVILRIRKDGEELVEYPLAWEKFDGNCDNWAVTLGYMSVGLYFYDFCVDGTNCGLAADGSCAAGGAAYQLTVYERAYDPPTWIEGGLIYQIMVDRFCAVDPPRGRSDVTYRDDWYATPEYRPVNGKILNNDFFGGNLKGVISKLDYLAGLHVTCIYLNPVFRANSNHKYDTADYFRIDPDFGTNEDLRALVHEAEKHGMRVILDGVFSHTGDDSIYFNRYGNFDSVGAYQSRKSPYYRWYKFAAWPKRYDSWWGIDILPEVNETEPSYLDFVTGEEGVIAYWLEQGIAGWRLDVADELPDEFLARLAARAKATKPDALVLGEVWEDASNKISYSVRRKYFLGKELDSVTNYVFRSAILDYLATGEANVLARRVGSVVKNYPPEVLHCLMNVVGTHDTPRMLTMLSGVDGRLMTRDERAEFRLRPADLSRAKEKLFLAAVLQYMLPGVPCLFYGDEAGLEGFEDPFNRRCYPWGREDRDILAFYRKLGEIRAACPELAHGEYACEYAYGSTVIFRRGNGPKRLYIGVNVGNSPFVKPSNEQAYDCFTGEKLLGTFAVPPMGYRIVRTCEEE